MPREVKSDLVSSVAPAKPQIPSELSDAHVELLRAKIGIVFNEAQQSAIGHGRHVSKLCSLLEQAVRQGVEDIFNYAFLLNLFRLLPHKRGVSTVDNCIKLCESFVSRVREIDLGPEENFELIAETESVTTRLVTRIIDGLLPGITAKKKAVSFRASHIILTVLNVGRPITRDVYTRLKTVLAAGMRITDPFVRANVVSALALLQDSDEEEDDEDDYNDSSFNDLNTYILDVDLEHVSVTRLLLWALRFDPSSEVRRTAMKNIALTPRLLPFILESARDENSVNRRLVFTSLMKEIGDFLLINIEPRKKLLSSGLADRDDSVKKAAITMFGKDWVNSTKGGIIGVLERLDVQNNDKIENAIKMFLRSNQDYLDKFEFDDQFWGNLSPESAIFAKCYRDINLEDRLTELDEKFPELTKLSYVIDHYLDQVANYEVDEEDIETYGKYDSMEFICIQLLKIARTYDFHDEVGRRDITGRLERSLTNGNFSASLYDAIICVLRNTLDESMFTHEMCDLISDIRDPLPDEEAEPRATMSPSRSPGSLRGAMSPDGDFYRDSTRSVASEAKCLMIAYSTLDLLWNPIQSDIYIISIINSLVFDLLNHPSPLLREWALKCTALAAIMSEEVAKRAIDDLVANCENPDPAIAIFCFQAIQDLLMIHGITVFGPAVNSLYQLYLHYIDHQNIEIRTAVIRCLCKLLVLNIFNHPDVVKTLLLVYHSSPGEHSASFKQPLEYSLPFYCQYSLKNLNMMASVSLEVIQKISEDTTDTFSTSIGSTKILQQLLDWTNPLKVVGVDSGDAKQSDVQVRLGIDMLKMVSGNITKDVRRALCYGVSRIYIPADTIKSELLLELKEQIDSIVAGQRGVEPLPKNAVKVFGDSLEEIIKIVQAREANENTTSHNIPENEQQDQLQNLESHHSEFGDQNFTSENNLNESNDSQDEEDDNSNDENSDNDNDNDSEDEEDREFDENLRLIRQQLQQDDYSSDVDSDADSSTTL